MPAALLPCPALLLAGPVLAWFTAWPGRQAGSSKTLQCWLCACSNNPVCQSAGGMPDCCVDCDTHQLLTDCGMTLPALLPRPPLR